MIQKYPVLDIKPETTAQEVFDAVAKHLLTQNKKSTANPNVLSGCLYRAPNGTACAVGCLLTDAEAKSLDSGIFIAPARATPLIMSIKGCIKNHTAPDRLNRYENLLADLQTVHDQNTPDLWPSLLRRLARARNLNANVLPPL